MTRLTASKTATIFGLAALAATVTTVISSPVRAEKGREARIRNAIKLDQQREAEETGTRVQPVRCKPGLLVWHCSNDPVFGNINPNMHVNQLPVGVRFNIRTPLIDNRP